jgi:subtilisin family serine protease
MKGTDAMLRDLKVLAVWLAVLLLCFVTSVAEANPNKKKKSGGGGFGLSVTVGVPPISSTKKKTATVKPKPTKKTATAKKTPPATAKKKKPTTALAKATGVPPKGETRFLPDEVLFELKPDAAEDALAEVVQTHNIERIAEADIALLASTLHRYRIPDGRTVAEVVAALENDPRIAFAQPDYVYELTEEVTAASLAPAAASAQYALEKLRVREAHRQALGNGVLVAVIDSRIDGSHPALAGSISAEFTAVDTPSPEAHPHGTAMAGAIAAHSEMTGIAPAVSILAVEAFAKDASGHVIGLSYHLVRGVDWAHGKGSRLFNLSFAGPRDPALLRTMGAARRSGGIFIAAAGNAGAKSPPLYPAADENAIAVTAIDDKDTLGEFANRGKHIALAAPGVDILVIAPGGSADLMSGTSVAAAHITGIAALALERAVDLDLKAVRKLFKDTAHALKAPPAEVGAGLADALAAVETAAALASKQR